MVPPSEINADNLICDIKLSTVVPASITPEDKIHHLTGADLAMKLHHITTVHFFGGDAAEGLSIEDFKRAMFQWLQLYYPISGRIRRHDGDGGRPFVKCNDSGVRIVEAKCAKTVAEWLASVDGGDYHRRLVYHQPLLDRDFGFTPLVFLQLTRFKCGGVCVGMRWTHILGDAFSATECINTWGKIMANQKLPPHSLDSPPITPRHVGPMMTSSFCHSLKPLDSLGDNWLTPNNFKMQTHTFHITQKQLNSLLSEDRNKCNKITINPFEVISAIVWKSMAKIKETKIITVCKKGKFDSSILENKFLGNTHQVIGTVEAENTSLIADSDPIEIAKMIGEEFVDETSLIEKRMEEGDGNVDVLVYGGSNLTFVDLEGVDLYGLEMNGQGPVFADVSIGGVGDEGAVVVVPNAGQQGRIVNVILPENQLQLLKDALRSDWGLF
ncbi:PREDICTED: protein ECERIFERUM 1 [Erythranthe guttata]|nr:PREDICTED: protein ECERIFERUM 1 [Erythranthe guttata]|eukprot:XP_012838847.1 PREDICTED: protein ECERIFERUM 1 [Erythranthe guttata]